MKRISLLISALLLVLNLLAQNNNLLPFQKWALTPPMGWNSWDCFGPSVVEAEVKENADYMAENLLEFGWEYIVVDIRWYVDNQTTGHYNHFNNSTFILDEYGRYLPSPKRFPSSVHGKGFKPLSDYVHNLGLKFGIHIMRGVPKVAVNNKLPIKGTKGITADKIYSTAYECTWLQDNYTVDASKEGAQEYYNSIFELYAEWGVDYVKIDDLSRPYHDKEIEMIRIAIDNCGRPMVLSMSPGATPLEQHEHAKNHANLWRTVDDFWDNWSQLNYQFGVCADWAPYISPGAWPDADMLPMGHLSIRGERGEDRYTNFTRDEQFTMMTLWTMFKSPLMFGGHMPDNDKFTNSLLTNTEILEVHRNSINNGEWFNSDDKIAWKADDPKTGDKIVALFNTKGNGFVKTNNALYRSGTISRLTDNHGIDINIEIPVGSKKLFLVVTDNGDGNSCDHADWIEPTIYLSNGDSILLTDLEPTIASTGWGTININKSIAGGALQVKDRIFSNGIATHSQSVLAFDIPETTIRFKTFAGIAIEGIKQACGSTVEFIVDNNDLRILRNKDNELANTDSTKIAIDLKALGFDGNVEVRDLWEQKDLGTFKDVDFAPYVREHGAKLYRISKRK